MKVGVFHGFVAMDGDGPSHGSPFELGAIIASQDPFAADTVAVELVRLDAWKVPYLRLAWEREYIGNIEVVGDKMEDFVEARKSFRIPAGMKRNSITRWLKVGRRYLTAVPYIDPGKCRKCGVCAKSCSPGAISFAPGVIPSVDLSKCIRCYCCNELCPHNAVTLERGLLARMAGRILER
ncbi:MAG: 4Fe-4S binding protein [Candidatus Fermentithermobacillus carboniphilus]|uniref:4Fe-4S binding protein n=1 Tax=Candidatus Fermentithermobacillus carboniphilus TaxID=3085328 RepID=A0AAT9LGM4_9FIRM|nr:MAG: 4Fe-4S binding protein [Candidatus Fermentithermobacillus carboniphilus]